MERREFIKKIGVASVGVPLLFHDLQVQAMTSMLNISSQAEDRVLVLVRLNGGNDGLNTIIPITQYANLTIQRPNVIIPESSILDLNGSIGMHPVMTGMRDMYQDGKLGVIHSVGYPEQNRSHFRSMDIWSSGLIDAPATTGWLGRKLQNDYPAYPNSFPNEADPHPFAINMGKGVSSTCQGTKSNFSHTVKDPTEQFDLSQGDFVHDGSCHSNQLEYINELINQTNLYGAKINEAGASGNTISQMYDENNDLAVQFRNVAKLISGGLQTNLYILNVNGFDTHAEQVDSKDSTIGEHAHLMKTVSNGIAAFQDDLKLLGLEDRVMGMTFSEFGRQVASNASYGTDHGDAAPLMMFGACLDFSEKGTAPVISDTVVKQEAVPMQVDFRDVYASVLKDWFGVPKAEIQSLFEQNINYQNLISCSVAIGIEDELDPVEVLAYPNPAHYKTTIRFNSESEWVKISVLDALGNQMLTVVDSNLSSGLHDVEMDVSSLSSGTYLVTIQKESGEVATKLQKF